jgi:hypothetical protein
MTSKSDDEAKQMFWNEANLDRDYLSFGSL